MSTHFHSALAVALLVLGPALASAEEAVPTPVKELLARLVPDRQPTSVRPAPAPGLYEVAYGTEVVYVSTDGRYLMKGDLLDMKDQRNLTEQVRSSARLAALEEVGEQSMVVFAPGQTRHTVTVFTDIDCPYCVKFHQEVPELNRQGVKVRYMAFPRAGVGSPGFRKAVSVWCAEDRQQAMSDAKAGKSVAQKQCDNPVEEHYELGQAIGVTGTPSLVLEDGRVIPGYVPAARLAQVLSAPR
jgi:thiol:disulfide interchange protein DsbC